MKLRNRLQMNSVAVLGMMVIYGTQFVSEEVTTFRTDGSVVIKVITKDDVIDDAKITLSSPK